MSGLLALSRGIDRVTTLIGRSVAWLILLAVVISSTNAIIRKVFSMSSNAWLERSGTCSAQRSCWPRPGRCSRTNTSAST